MTNQLENSIRCWSLTLLSLLNNIRTNSSPIDFTIFHIAQFKTRFPCDFRHIMRQHCDWINFTCIHCAKCICLKSNRKQLKADTVFIIVYAALDIIYIIQHYILSLTSYEICICELSSTRYAGALFFLLFTSNAFWPKQRIHWLCSCHAVEYWEAPNCSGGIVRLVRRSECVVDQNRIMLNENIHRISVTYESMSHMDGWAWMCMCMPALQPRKLIRIHVFTLGN